jgi:hypothetical protein
VVGDFVDPEARCDGLHVLEAPDHMLCTHCFPNGREALPETYADDGDDDDDEPNGES